MTGPSVTHAVVGQSQPPLGTISNLPIEVFHKIVPLAAKQDQPYGYYDRLRALRLVTTSWMALIDDCPQFWSLVQSPDSEPVWRMALQKSKAAGIDVYSYSFHVPRYPQAVLVRAVVEHMPRVRTLVVQDPDFEYLIANAPAAPRLQSLHIRRGWNYSGPIVPSLHPAEWAPNLRDLDLERPRAVWRELRCRDLEHLRIHADPRVLSIEAILIVLQASPGLRTLHLRGIRLSRHPSDQITLPSIKLEALESLELCEGGPPVDTLNSIIASPTRFELYPDYDDGNQQAEALRGIGKFASRIADGRDGTVLKFSDDPYPFIFGLGGLEVIAGSAEPGKPNPSTACVHILEGLPPQLRSAVKTLEISHTNPSSVLELLSVINSLCSNISHLEIPTLNEALATALGETDDGSLFPHLESLSITHFPGRLNAIKVARPRLRAFEAGKHVAKLKKMSLIFFMTQEKDEGELAELKTLVPEFILRSVGGT